MPTTDTATVRPSRVAAATMLVARLMLGIMGLAGLAGATYFAFFASPEEGGVVTAFDWFVAAWKTTVSLGFITVVALPSIPRTLRVQLATWLLLADVVFGLVKYFGYAEREAVGFFLVDAVLLGLIHLSRSLDSRGWRG